MGKLSFSKQGSGGGRRVFALLADVALPVCLAVVFDAAEAQTMSSSTVPAGAGQDSTAMRFYGGFEYLNWWVKGAPLSVPLVSTGPIETTHHGLLGPPAENGADSTVLYGSSHAPAQGGNDVQNFSGAPGAKLTAGYWIDQQRRFAVEASAFYLGTQSAGFAAAGDADGNPVLGIPVQNSVTYNVGAMLIFPGEDSLPFSLPDNPFRARANGIITGGIDIRNTESFWGADLKGAVSLYRDPTWELSSLAGFRHLNLSEGFSLTTDIVGVTGPYAGQSGIAHDGFKTSNQFYGAAFGLRGAAHFGRWFAELTAQIAPGVSHQMVDVTGGFTSVNYGASSGPEGVFAQPANEGRRVASRFAFTTDSELKIGYDVSPNVRLTLAYEHIYYSSVVRPTDQIDRNIPKGQTFLQSAPTISTTSPAKLFNTTSFYAQGLNVGVGFRF
jgi:hypothetical protein